MSVANPPPPLALNAGRDAFCLPVLSVTHVPIPRVNVADPSSSPSVPLSGTSCELRQREKRAWSRFTLHENQQSFMLQTLCLDAGATRALQQWVP